jgi:hypothetical protein
MPRLYPSLTCFFLLVVPFPSFRSSQNITFKRMPCSTVVSTGSGHLTAIPAQRRKRLLGVR